jgi:MFS family permease
VSARARAVAGGCAVGTSIGWPLTNVGAVAEELAAEYGVALATVGLFTTALFVVHVLMQIPAGRLVDRLGARRVAFLALAIGVAANGLALLAPEPGLAIAMRALAGFGTAFGFVAGIDYVRTQSGSPFAQGLFGGISLGAGGLALLVLPAIEDGLGWRAPFLTAAVIAGLAAAVLAFGPADPPRPARFSRLQAGGTSVLRDTRIYRICVVYMASFGLTVVLSNWVVTLLTRAGDYSDAAAGAVGSLILTGGIVSRPLGGHLARVYPGRTRIFVAGSFAASLVGTAGLATAGPPALTGPAALLLGLAAGIPFAASFGTATRIRPDAPAVAAAMVNMSANIVIVACTPLLGLAFSLPGDGRIGFAAVAGLWLAAIAVTPSAHELDHATRPGG